MEMKKSNSLIKKLKGYQRAERDRFLRLTFDELTLEEFVLYELYAAITDWDSKHYETFGTFGATNKDVAQILKWKSDSTVGRYRKNLIKKGLIEKVGERFRIKDFDNWVSRKRPAEKQTFSAKMQVKNAIMQEEPADMQDIPF